MERMDPHKRKADVVERTSRVSEGLRNGMDSARRKLFLYGRHSPYLIESRQLYARGRQRLPDRLGERDSLWPIAVDADRLGTDSDPASLP